MNAVKNLRDVLVSFPRKASIEPSEDPLDVKVILPTGRCIGIEVTDFVRDRSPKGSHLDSFQKLTRKLMREAETAYAKRGARPLYSAVYFANNFECPANKVSAYAEQMAARVAQIAESVRNPLSIEDGLPVGVGRIIVHPGAMPLPQFAPVYADSWEYLTDAHIDAILEKKEPKVPTYRAKCDDVWLLIYVDGTRMSGWVEPPLNMQLRSRQTSFDRIFFLYDASRVIEVSRGS